jgi:hypothetical protein
MTGPEHYRAAERMLDGTPMDQQAALVHATLALAAATAEPIAQSYDGPDDTTIPMAWSKAIS